MTQNQIAYWNMQNQLKLGQQEQETKRRGLTEQERANKAKESLQQDIQEAQKKRMKYQNFRDVAGTILDPFAKVIAKR